MQLETLRQFALKTARSLFPRSETDAQDLTQDAMLRLCKMERKGSFVGRFVPTEYVKKVVRNIFLNRLRKTKCRVSEISLSLTIEDAPLIEVIPCVDAELPEVAAIQSELSETLAEMMANMKPADRECLSLFSDGLSYIEIGEVLGVPLTTVRKRIFHARQRVMRRYEGLVA